MFRVIESFATTVDGVPRVFNVDAIVRAGDPVLKGRSRFFEPLEDHLARFTETASAGPDEKRSRSRAVKKAAAPSAKD